MRCRVQRPAGDRQSANGSPSGSRMGATADLWRGYLDGRHSDLQHLERCFGSHPPRISVTKDDREGGFIDDSDAFVGCAASDKVLAVAKKELSVLAGGLKLPRASREPVRAAAVYRCNASGGRDVFVRDTLRVRVDFDVSVEATTCERQRVTAFPSVPRRVSVTRRCKPEPERVVVGEASGDLGPVRTPRIGCRPDGGSPQGRCTVDVLDSLRVVRCQPFLYP